MKTIGFIDYYISEWHAQNYPQWIKEQNKKMGEDFVVKYVWAERDDSLFDGATTDDYCAKYGVEKCASIAELCEKADYVLILAPSDPDKHLEYAKEAFKCGKNTYVDKTFAPDYKTAKEIFDTAEKYGTKFFSSSALRYSTELDELPETKSIITLGGGGNLDEYIIHQVEMVVKKFAVPAKKVKVEKQGAQYVIRAIFEDDKSATMIFAPGLGFSMSAENANGDTYTKKMVSPYFQNLIADILRFYNTGETSFDTTQTLMVMKLREALIKAKETDGVWIEV